MTPSAKKVPDPCSTACIYWCFGGSGWRP